MRNTKANSKAGSKDKLKPKMKSYRIKKPSEPKEMKPKAKAAAVFKGFSELWTRLFTSRIHLDSGLSKQSPQIKSILAQILPSILLRPASLAEVLGVGVMEGEPWSLDEKKLPDWRPAQLMAERIYELMTQGGAKCEPLKEDFPPEMISEWEASWSATTVKDLVNTLGREAPLSLRASRKVGAQALLAGLTSTGPLPVRAELSTLTPLGIRLGGYVPVLGTEWYKKGGFEIQDEGSQFMALFALWPERYGSLLKDRPGKIQNLELPAPPLPKDPPAWVVIDACSGAGGKALAISDALKGKGRVYAYDTSEVKLQALRRRATHAGLNNIQAVHVTEGSELETIHQFKATAQIVLVDAPCSGWGVLRRNPDIKWRQTKEVLTRMPEIQFRLLSQYSQLVAPGGRLIYGVCTFRQAETRHVIDRFIAENPKFTVQEGGYLGPGPCDGFFMQSLVRTA